MGWMPLQFVAQPVFGWGVNNPVLCKGEKFNLKVVQKEVTNYLASVMIPTKDEEMFWQDFQKGSIVWSGYLEKTGITKHIQLSYGIVEMQG